MTSYRHPNYFYVSVIEISKNEIEKIDFAACKEPRETLGSFYDRQKIKPNILMNAGFFGMSNGVPVFNLIDNGEYRSKDDRYIVGMGTARGKENTLIFGTLRQNIKWNDFINAYPVLLCGKGPITKFTYANEIDYKACRSCLAMNDTTIFCIHIGLPGMRFKEMSEMLHNMGCKYAINLDGGGSARMLLNGEVYGYPTENRAVDSVLAIYAKSNASNNSFGFNTPFKLYITEKGDSWWSIAKTQLGDGKKYKDLMEFNKAGDVLRVGQTIKLPVKEYIYTVKAGDSWWSIAQNEMGSGTKYMKLIEYNNAVPTQPLFVGQTVKIPL